MTNVWIIKAYGVELQLQSLLTSALEGSSELHTPVALLLAKQPPTPIQYEAWGGGAVWTLENQSQGPQRSHYND